MNTFMKVAMVSSVMVMLASGCASTSTYKNYSSRDGNHVEATGQAAAAAGASHSSYNCINCSSGSDGHRQSQYGGSQQSSSGMMEDSASRIVQSASSAVSSVIYQSIYGVLR